MTAHGTQGFIAMVHLKDLLVLLQRAFQGKLRNLRVNKRILGESVFKGFTLLPILLVDPNSPLSFVF